MILLVSGVLLFAAVHFIPSLAPQLKANLWERMGEGGYKGIFSLLLLSAFGLMIFGWRSTQPTFIYSTPEWLRIVAFGLVIVAFLLLAVSQRKSRLRRLVRHPQLMGVALWGISHLMLNGDSRSLVLFGGLSAWALLEMPAINRREGTWVKEPAPEWGTEAVNVIIAAVTIGVLILVHPWLSGRSVF